MYLTWSNGSVYTPSGREIASGLTLTEASVEFPNTVIRVTI